MKHRLGSLRRLPGSRPGRAAGLGLLLALLVSCSEERPAAAVQAPMVQMRYGRERVFRDLVLYSRAESIGGPFFLDRFEATRGDFEAWLQATGQDAPEFVMDRWRGPHAPPGTASLPVTGINLSEARRFAAWCFVRVPRAAEWLHAATGNGLYRNPWGDSMQETFANTNELGLGRLQPVGTFESGREPGGAYDLIGNAAEWTETVRYWFFDTWEWDGGSWVPVADSLERLWTWRPAWHVLAATGLAHPHLPAPAAWLVAAVNETTPREVVGGHCGMALEDSGVGAEPVEAFPQDRHDRVGVRFATDPGDLLEALLQAERNGVRVEERVTAALRAFLRQPDVRAALKPAWPAARQRVPGPGPLGELLAAELAR